MTLSAAEIAKVRALLVAPTDRPNLLATLTAATLAATAAVLMAGVMVLGPGVALDEPAAREAALPAG